MSYVQLLTWANDASRTQVELSAAATGLGLNPAGTVGQLRSRIRALIARQPDLTVAAPWAPVPAAPVAAPAPAAAPIAGAAGAGAGAAVAVPVTTATTTRTTTTTRNTRDSTLLALVTLAALLLLACLACVAGSALSNAAQGRGLRLLPIMGISLARQPVVVQPVAAPIVQPAQVTVGVGLKYDETDCNPAALAACRNSGQSEFPAVLVRNIQSGDRSLIDGIVAIQQLFASTPNSQVWDSWSSLNVDDVYPSFIWCPGNNCAYPPDTAFPLMGIPALEHVQFSIAIVSAHAPADPPAGITQVTCPNGDCWAGLLR